MRTNERQKQYDIAYMNMAIAMAQLSHAKRKKVGCVIVKDDTIIAQGYNGMPKGFDNNCEDEWCTYYKYDKKIEDINYWATECSLTDVNRICDTCKFKGLKTKSEVLHAETNAIAKCAKSTNSTLGATLYVTMSPCIDCAKSIIQAGIKEVYYLEMYNGVNADAGIKLLSKAGISVKPLLNEIEIEGYQSPAFLPNIL